MMKKLFISTMLALCMVLTPLYGINPTTGAGIGRDR